MNQDRESMNQNGGPVIGSGLLFALGLSLLIWRLIPFFSGNLKLSMILGTIGEILAYTGFWLRLNQLPCGGTDE